MSNHITINGQTYASVDQMPSEIRRQYEAAMQKFAADVGVPVSAADSEVTISTQDRDPTHHVSRVDVRRFMVNGKEYHDLKDVPAEARAAFQEAGLGDPAAAPVAANFRQTDISRTPAYRPLHDAAFDPPSGITMRLPTLAVLLLVAVLAGVFIGWKLLH
jgi:hypothetical protein